MNSAFLSVVSVAAISMVSFVGLLAFSLNELRLRRLSTILISFAAGSLLGDAFIHLIPASFESREPPLRQSLLMLAGMMTFFAVEKIMRHRHGALHAGDHLGNPARPELAAMNVIGDAVHNLIDGILSGASYLAETSLGITTTVAVLFHEIPQEMGDFSILVHSGLSPRKAVLFNFASGSVAILGTAMALLAGTLSREAVISVLVPATAGGFIYLAAADLIPELQHERTLGSLVRQVGLMALGIGVMVVLTLLES
jgi:zinc and cadmium transporter